MDGLLDFLADAFLDLLRRGTRVDHAHVDPVRREFRKYLLPQRPDGHHADDRDEDRQQICGDPVLREPFDQAIHMLRICRCGLLYLDAHPVDHSGQQ